MLKLNLSQIREPNRATKKLKSRSRHKSKANNNTNRHEVNAHKKKKRENHTDTDTTSNNNRNKPLSTIISPIVSTNVQHSKKKQRILNFERHATEGHTSLFSAAGLPSVLGHQISSTNHLIQVNKTIFDRFLFSCNNTRLSIISYVIIFMICQRFNILFAHQAHRLNLTAYAVLLVVLFHFLYSN